MQIKIKKRLYMLVQIPCFFVSLAFAAESYSPYTDQTYPTNVYWGDTHLHTNLSEDAYLTGNTKLGPEEAYRFARGEAITAHNDMQARLHRPLDFLVIADHAANMGIVNGLVATDPDLLSSETGRLWLSKFEEMMESGYKSNFAKSTELYRQLFSKEFRREANDEKFYYSFWENATMLADKYNEPGLFTAFIGYEWTEVKNNLHRVVIFKDGAEMVSKTLPFSRHDSSDPEGLWVHMEQYEKTTGGEVLAIPHNGNLSRGTMFALENMKGESLSAQYAKTRSRWEPLFEATQIKGDSEAHPALSPTDEFADYATMLPISSNSAKDVLKNPYGPWIKKHIQGGDENWMPRFGYARSGLKLGLAQQAKLGVNPFKFGMIGSTDAHTSLATADENNYWGKFATSEPHPTRITSLWNPATKHLPLGWQMNAAGYAGVWATENTREALFAAMKRKEVYATTGPRMAVRFFGGWDYQSKDAFKPDLARIGYGGGVPMGGDLANAPEGKDPSFLIRAVKDPDGANLDRVQVIKGWHDKKGELHEKIYNVAVSDGRKETQMGKVKPVGNTVDIKDASYTNTIGDPELAVVWTDPDFDKDELAFYYIRVLEIPTPRWTAYDAKYFGVKDTPKKIPMVTQERAYTSPIWYTPAGL